LGYFIYEIYYSTLIVVTVKEITKIVANSLVFFLNLIIISDKFYMQFIDVYSVF